MRVLYIASYISQYNINQVLIEHDRPISSRERLRQIVGDHQRRQVVFRHNRPRDLHDLIRRRRVKRRCVLIQKKKLWHDKRTHEKRHNLSLTT